MFGLLVAKLVLVLPHSNADEERVFDQLSQKNKNPFCANLSLDTTLPSILQCKVNAFSHIKNYALNINHFKVFFVMPSPLYITWQYNKELMNIHSLAFGYDDEH